MGSSAQIERKQAEEICDRASEKVMSRGRERHVPRRGEWWAGGWREVIIGDLLLQPCIEEYTVDRSVMDFRMS